MTITRHRARQPRPDGRPARPVVDGRASVYRTFEQDTAPVRALRGADLDARHAASSSP